MKLERINTAKGFCAKRSQRIPELHRNTAHPIPLNQKKLLVNNRNLQKYYRNRLIRYVGSFINDNTNFSILFNNFGKYIIFYLIHNMINYFSGSVSRMKSNTQVYSIF